MAMYLPETYKVTHVLEPVIQQVGRFIDDIFLRYVSLHLRRRFFFLQLLEIVKREGLSLTAVLTTHHHW